MFKLVQERYSVDWFALRTQSGSGTCRSRLWVHLGIQKGRIVQIQFSSPLIHTKTFQEERGGGETGEQVRGMAICMRCAGAVRGRTMEGCTDLRGTKPGWSAAKSTETTALSAMVNASSSTACLLQSPSPGYPHHGIDTLFCPVVGHQYLRSTWVSYLILQQDLDVNCIIASTVNVTPCTLLSLRDLP